MGLKFLNVFFTQKKYDLENVTITLEERSAYDIHSEDYRFRVKISEVVDEIYVYCRDMAIENHHKQDKHQEPHLQFKLHADKIGHIHIFLPVKNADDYKKYILSFLDIIGQIMIKLDNPKKELQTKFMVRASFKEIEGMGTNIKQLVQAQYQKNKLTLTTFDKDERSITEEDVKKIKEIPQIAPFFEDV